MPLPALAVPPGACRAPFAGGQSFSVQEGTVCSRAGLWLQWGILPAELSCRAGPSPPCQPRLAELDLQLCCASGPCERLPEGMVGI